MTKRTKVTAAEILSVIPGSKGLIFKLEQRLNCTRSAIKSAIADNPELKKELEDEQEREKDQVIANLIEDAKAGDKAARELYLKSQARDRGFGDKLEVAGQNGQPLVVLHALCPNVQVDHNKTKQERIESWSKKAIDYHEKQLAEAQSKSVDELLSVGEQE